jgi:predicted nuclease of predicted toxin-antitoxin system
MPRTILFHLDENCHRAVAEGLRRRGIDVTTTPEAGLMSGTDEEQTTYGLAQGRVIVTHDRDFLRLNAAGVPHAGIVFCAKDTKNIGDIIQGLALIWELLEPDEMRNRVEFL